MTNPEMPTNNQEISEEEIKAKIEDLKTIYDSFVLEMFSHGYYEKIKELAILEIERDKGINTKESLEKHNAFLREIIETYHQCGFKEKQEQ